MRILLSVALGLLVLFTSVPVAKADLVTDRVIDDAFLENSFTTDTNAALNIVPITNSNGVPSPEQSFFNVQNLLMREMQERHNDSAALVLKLQGQNKSRILTGEFRDPTQLLLYSKDMDALIYNQRFFLYTPHVVSVLLAFGYARTFTIRNAERLECNVRIVLPYQVAALMWQSQFSDIGMTGKLIPGDSIESYNNSLLQRHLDGSLEKDLLSRFSCTTPGSN